MTFAIKRMVRPRVAPVRSFTNPRRVDPNLVDEVLSQFIPLNDYGTPTFTRAGPAWDPFNRITAASGVRRRRPFRFRGQRTVWADLIEPSRTNLCVRSSDFFNWGTKTDVTVTSAALTPADGTGTADRILEGSLGTAAITSAAMTITAGRIVTASMRFKFKATNAWVMLTVASDTMTNGWRVWANLSTGVVGSQAAIGTGAVVGTATLTALGGGEYLLVSSGTVAAAATSIQYALNSASADASTTRVTAADYYAWGAQVEQMAASATTGYASSYIATTTAAVTRAADALSVPYVLGQTATVLGLFIPYGWDTDQDGITTFFHWTDNNGGSGLRYGRGNATASSLIIPDAGGNESTTALRGTGLNALYHLAGVWDSTSVRNYRNGVLSGTPDTTLTPPYNTNTSVSIGSNGVAQQFSGWVALLAGPSARVAPELLAIANAYPVAAAA